MEALKIETSEPQHTSSVDIRFGTWKFVREESLYFVI